MNIITKIILIVLSALCFFFLIFFTFFSGNNSQGEKIYNYLEQGNYTINNSDGEYSLSSGSISDGGDVLQLKNISIGNNIYYKSGSISINEKSIDLSPGIYYFDINSLDFDYTIYIEGAEIKIIGPGSFVVNNEATDNKNRVLSLSAKVELQLTFEGGSPDISDSRPALVHLYPHMFLNYNPQSNRYVKNGDLLRIDQVHDLFMFNGDIYRKDINENSDEIYILNELIKNGFFVKNTKYDLFLKEIYDYKSFRIQNFRKEFNALKSDNFYTLSGMQYIIDYTQYFINEEKKKTYFKNMIFKDLVQLINTKTGKVSSENIIQNLTSLRELSEDSYEEMKNIIYHYYENILITQHDNKNILINISQLQADINNTSFTFSNPSLISLHSMYENYHNGDEKNYYVYLNDFIHLHENEMKISIYDENNKVHGYFLFFVKNILSLDIESTESVEDLLIVLEKYLSIVKIYVEQGTSVIQKTILFDNVEILKAFTNMLEKSFIQDERNNKGLLVLKKPALLQETEYLLLKNNLETILDIFNSYNGLINGSKAQKDISIMEQYNQISDIFEQYIFAIDDYNGYEIKYGFVSNINLSNTDDQNNTDDDRLSLDNAKAYLESFNGIQSIRTGVSIKDYPFCINPDFDAENDNIKIEDGYCYEIKNLFIDGYIFSFILTPSQGNTVSSLIYKDRDNELVQTGKIYRLDEIEKSLEEKFNQAQSSEKERLNFKNFFINSFTQKDSTTTPDIPIDDNSPLLRDPSGKGENNPVSNRIKVQLLNDTNSPLLQIRDIVFVVFDSLVFTNNNGTGKLEVYPSDFKINVGDGNTTNSFNGKFEGEYNFNNTPHSFENVAIYIEDIKRNGEREYLLNGNPLHIDGTFDIINTKNILTDALFDFIQIDFIYSEILNIYGTDFKEVRIGYNIEKETVNFYIGKNVEIIFLKNENLSILQNGKIVDSGSYRNINTYLNNL